MLRIVQGPQRRREVTIPPAPVGPDSLLSPLPETREWIVKPLLFLSKDSTFMASHQAWDGQETFWAFNTNTINMKRVPSVLSRAHLNPSEPAPDFCQSGSTFTFQLNSNTQKRIQPATMQYCRDHPNVFVIIYSAGFRLPIAIPSHRGEPNIENFC